MPTLKEQAVHGVKWTTVSTVVTTVCQYVKLAILAHLLTTTDFGLMGMVMVIVGFAQAFADMGISNAIIYRQDSTQDELSSLYWLNIAAGIIVAGVVVAVTPLIVRFYHEPRLTSLIYWTSLVFLIIPLGQQFQMLLQKSLKFNRLAVVEMCAAIMGATVAITTAFLGFGVMSLIWGLIAESATKSLLFLIEGWKKWRPGLHFNRKDLKGYLSFGIYQMGDRSLDFYNSNIDYILIGRFLGPNALGIYTLAYQLIVTPLVRLNPIITKVAFPVFAKRQSEDDVLRRAFKEVSKMIALVAMPILVAIAATAPVLVPVVFGSKWKSAITVIQILVILGILKSLTNPVGSLWLAKGRADIGFKWNLFVAFITTGLYLLVVRNGIYAMALAESCLSCFLFIILLGLLNHLIKLKPLEYLGAVWRPAAMAGVMGAIVYCSYLLMRTFISSELVLFICQLVIVVIVYGLAVLMFEREFVMEYLRILLNKMGREA